MKKIWSYLENSAILPANTFRTIMRTTLLKRTCKYKVDPFFFKFLYIYMPLQYKKRFYKNYFSVDL